MGTYWAGEAGGVVYAEMVKAAKRCAERTREAQDVHAHGLDAFCNGGCLRFVAGSSSSPACDERRG